MLVYSAIITIISGSKRHAEVYTHVYTHACVHMHACICRHVCARIQYVNGLFEDDEEIIKKQR